MKIRSTLIALGLISFLSCSNQENARSSGPYLVATTGMVADLVQNIAGHGYRVEGLMGPGVDPHLYKASQGDIGKIASADVVFYNGLHLEGKMTDILEKMSRSRQVVAISSDIDEDLLLSLGDGSGLHDPHIWFDVSLWRRTIPVIRDALGKAYPPNQNIFAQNAAKMDSALAGLHQWVLEIVATVPTEQRIMITAHDAFGYFGKAYGIQVHGLQGISTVAEYGINDVNRMVDLVLDKRIRAVFIETSVPKRSIEAVLAGAEARGGDVRIGGSLYSDAMGPAGSGADTYIGMVRANVETIVKALK